MAISYGNGHYVRSRSGTWRYSLTGEEVPGASDLEVNGRIVMQAPELHPEFLMDIADAAAYCGMTRASWKVAVSQGRAPVSVVRLSISPFWTQGVLDAWLATRPVRGRGGAAA